MQITRIFKQVLLLSLCLFTSCAFAWQQLPGKAYEVAVGGKNRLWVIGTEPQDGGYGIYQWIGNDWEQIEGGGISIAVDRFGRPWVVNTAGQIFYQKNNRWVQIEGRATQIAIGGVDQAWMLGRDRVPGGFGIYKRWQGRWVKVEGGAVRIAVDRKGAPWVVNNKQQIFTYRNGRWLQLPGTARDIAMGGGTVWVVGANPRDGGYDIYSWNGRNWDLVDGGAVHIAVDNFGRPLVINDTLNIFKY